MSRSPSETALGVAARVDDVDDVEFDNCTTPEADVEAEGRYVELMTDPCHVPVEIVPSVVMLVAPLYVLAATSASFELYA